MAVYLAACVTSFLITFITLPIIIRFFLRRNLTDAPGKRKVHKKTTPSMGGVAIFVGFLMTVFIWIDFSEWEKVRFVVASLVIVFLLGIRDDIVPFRAMHKLFGQIVAVAILLFSGIHIGSFFGLFGIFEIPEVLGYALTAFVVIVVTNSFNLIDGLDGLAGSLGMVSLSAFGTWFWMVDQPLFALICFAMMGGILAFLVFNWEPSEIFMGDTGAMVIGMLLAVVAIHFMNVNHALPAGTDAKFESTIGTVACFIVVPLWDTLRIIILRASKGKSPFAPDKSHIHHSIMRLGLTHSTTSAILASINLLFILCAWMLREYSDAWVLSGMMALCITLSLLLDRLISRTLSSKRVPRSD